MIIDEKLLKTRFIIDPDRRPHIAVDTAFCPACQAAPCVHVCPAGCYKKEGIRIVFSWENCLECGSCRIVCPSGAIEWDYPRNGFGVCFRFG